MRLVFARGGRVEDPRRGNELTALPVAVGGQENAEAPVVAQHGVQARVRRLLARVVDEPGGVRFGPNLLPDLRLKILATGSSVAARSTNPST
jgi:hypothetical protein